MNHSHESAQRGVSPVIGVILMVAITVILAAVIATFVMGLGTGVQAESSAGVDVSTEGSVSTVTWVSAGNSEFLTVSVNEDDCLVGSDPDPETLESVGDSVTVDCNGLNDDETATITVTGDTSEGTTTVLRTETVPGGNAAA